MDMRVLLAGVVLSWVAACGRPERPAPALWEPIDEAFTGCAGG
jgi:hypothetical protein